MKKELNREFPKIADKESQSRPESESGIRSGSQEFSEGTSIDLGEDLLADNRELIPKISSLQQGAVSEQIRNAEILISEGLLSGAKRILRKLLRENSKEGERRYCLQIETLLEVIFQKEIQEILSDAPIPKDYQNENMGHEAVKGKGVLNDLPLPHFDSIISEKSQENIRSPKQIRDLIEVPFDSDYIQENFWDCISVYLQAGLIDEARDLLVKQNNQSPHFFSAQLLLAEIELERDDLIASEERIEEVLREPQLEGHLQIYGWYLKGRIFQKVGKPREAILWYELLGAQGFRDSPERLQEIRAGLKGA